MGHAFQFAKCRSKGHGVSVYGAQSVGLRGTGYRVMGHKTIGLWGTFFTLWITFSKELPFVFS